MAAFRETLDPQDRIFFDAIEDFSDKIYKMYQEHLDSLHDKFMNQLEFTYRLGVITGAAGFTGVMLCLRGFGFI